VFVRHVIPDFSKDGRDCIFRVKHYRQSKKSILQLPGPEDDSTQILEISGNTSPTTALHPRRLIFITKPSYWSGTSYILSSLLLQLSHQYMHSVLGCHRV